MKSICHCSNIRFAARKLTEFYDRRLEIVGLTLPQFSLLRRLGREGEVNMNGLAKLAALDRTTLVRNLRPLLDAGLIKVAADEMDARQKRVCLTARGRKKVSKAMPLWESAQASVEEILGPGRINLLDDLAEMLPALR